MSEGLTVRPKEVDVVGAGLYRRGASRGGWPAHELVPVWIHFGHSIHASTSMHCMHIHARVWVHAYARENMNVAIDMDTRYVTRHDGAHTCTNQ